MRKSEVNTSIIKVFPKGKESSVTALKKKKIERLKWLINDEDYIKEAIVRLANSLTSGLMK